MAPKIISRMIADTGTTTAAITTATRFDSCCETCETKGMAGVNC